MSPLYLAEVYITQLCYFPRFRSKFEHVNIIFL